ncbi:MAG TPA: haloacid dehalogenase type II, partial [Thermoanaerobaculia bacterium]|nr:haloacid dehalogenase type II [Thermoanaerobaculia bacterium]
NARRCVPRSAAVTRLRRRSLDVRQFDLVAFDLYGTLLDVSGLAARMEPLAGGDVGELLGRWRLAQLERSWAVGRGAPYEPWDAVTLRALEEVAPAIPGETRRRLADLWLDVPAFPDASATLDGLKRAGARRAVLSNGTAAMIRAALAASGLDVDEILSADAVRAYKTDPRVYALLDDRADPARVLFVSANGWDVDGAGRAGRTVAWVDRGGEPPSAPPRFRLHGLADVLGIVGRA